MTVHACGHRIIQIHPSRRCNLQCLHCYSSSSPTVTEALDVDLLSDAIADASREGFEVASFSGGEPLLYKGLIDLMDHAHLYGMSTSMVSNGMLLTEGHLEQLVGSLDILAISLDGRPETHNRMRNQKQAFETMQSRLPALRASGIPFGFVFTLSKNSIKDFDWVLEFALGQGAALLQVHALEEAGRAENTLTGKAPDDTLAAYIYLQVMRAQKKVGDRLMIQLDLAHQNVMRAHPEVYYSGDETSNLESASLSDLISPLIIETSGQVVPLQYGFGDRYALGNLKDMSLSEMGQQWKQNNYAEFLNLCQSVYQNMIIPQKLPVVNWYARMSEQAQRIPVKQEGILCEQL